MKDYGPGAALAVAIIVAILYEQGGGFQYVASLIILAVLITPINGKSLVVDLLEFLNSQLKGN
jgi:hypothetical protein